jgi:hypothetical protein
MAESGRYFLPIFGGSNVRFREKRTFAYQCVSYARIPKHANEPQ